ncbi:GNAT family N-acetyltransferase [Caballeronia sordidicola]|uniref:Histone acetyltransferase HPA2 n=1 Tax=Caballeronia sordidicola TaxID=196367 RepID=A0A242N044_CABSO|nr:GNAT family N-acetyltransferase [Caballeronia sordidicola]OTP76932.1 Histone acetyltransferase HPA2 [Caballeronia sordidicola]
MNLDMRQAVSADSEGLYETYKETMVGFVTQATGWDEHAQRTGFAKGLRQGSCRIVMQGDERCGFVHWEVEPDLVWLRMLCVVPSVQRQGIGREMLNDMASLAYSLNKPLYLHVFRSNRIAYAWYGREGFVETDDDATVATLMLGGG